MITLTLTLYTIEKKLYGEQPNSVACVVIVFLLSSPRLTNSTLNSSSNFRQEHPGKNNPQMHGSTSLSLPLLPPSLLITHMLLIQYIHRKICNEWVENLLHATIHDFKVHVYKLRINSFNPSKQKYLLSQRRGLVCTY